MAEVEGATAVVKSATRLTTWRTWFLFAVVLIVVSTGGAAYLQASRAGPEPAPDIAETPTSLRSVDARVTRQAMDGATSDDMDQQFLDRLGQYLVARLNQEGPDVHRHEGFFVDLKDKKYAVIQLHTNGVMPMVQVARIQNGELVRVTCVSRLMEDISITTDACSTKFEEAFGIRPSDELTPTSAGPANARVATQHRTELSTHSSFEAKRFDDITIFTPKDWRWMSGADAIALNTNSEASADSIGFDAPQGNNKILLAGSAPTDHGDSSATIRLSVRSGVEGSQREMRGGLAEPQDEIEAAMLGELEKTAAGLRKLPGTTYYRVVGGGLRQNDSMVCIWSSFEYDAGRGPTVSDSWVCPVGDRSIKLSTSYRKSGSALHQATIDYIWRSLNVENAR